MNKDSIKKIKTKQEYRLLIRNLRKKEEEMKDGTANDKKADCNQSK